MRSGEYFVLLTRALGHVAVDKRGLRIFADSSLVFIDRCYAPLQKMRKLYMYPHLLQNSGCEE